MKKTIFCCCNQEHIFVGYGWDGPDLPDNVDEDGVEQDFFSTVDDDPDSYLSDIWSRIEKKFGDKLEKMGVNLEYRSAFSDWNGGDYCGRICDWTGGKDVECLVDEIEEEFFRIVKEDQEDWWKSNKDVYLTGEKKQ